MHNFRTNPPSRALPPRPALKPSAGYLRRTLPASATLDRLERFGEKRAVALSALGRLIANDPRLIFDLRSGREARPATTRKIETFLAKMEDFDA